jgi:type IV secretion system protein VirB10
MAQLTSSYVAANPSGPPQHAGGNEAGSAAANAAAHDDRAYATALLNPDQTVPKGAVIQAVLETALDSSRPGFARAIVSRDVPSFDGTKVLIPRGSKLYGEYAADVQRGQSRALIQWHRLLRPDGVLIELNSPSADPLGRAGVTGKVNTHFIERFGGMVLQSVLDIGVQLATSRATGGTVVVPLATNNISPIRPEDIKPTVKVAQGTSVSVFVMRDLDFSALTK